MRFEQTQNLRIFVCIKFSGKQVRALFETRDVICPIITRPQLNISMGNSIDHPEIIVHHLAKFAVVHQDGLKKNASSAMKLLR